MIFITNHSGFTNEFFMPEKIWFANKSVIIKNDLNWLASLLIHESYHAISSLLSYVGYPIQFKYWGDLNTDNSQVLKDFPWRSSGYNMGLEQFDKKNVVYRGHFTSQFYNITLRSLGDPFLALFNYLNAAGTEVRTGAGVQVSKDYIINDVIKEYPYFLDSKRYPCLCEVLSAAILQGLDIDHLFAPTLGWIRPQKKDETTHVHFEFLDIFYKNPEIRKKLTQALSDFTVVESPYISLIDQNALYELYVAYNGLYLKFKDVLKKDYKLKIMGAVIEKEDVGFFENPVIAKMMSPGMTYTDTSMESIFARRDIFFCLPGRYWDPMIAALAAGELNTVGLRNLPPPGTRVVLKLFYSSDEKAPISTHSFLWPKIPIRDFALGR